MDEGEVLVDNDIPADAAANRAAQSSGSPPPAETEARESAPADVSPAPDDAPTAEVPIPGRRRRRRWIIGLSIAGALIVILIIASFVTAHYTSASPFCVSCHEMDPYNTSWQDSAHASPAAECRDCHIPPGALSYIETKLFSFREIWVHLTEHSGEGHSESPLAVTREIPNSSCFRCHETPGDMTLGNVPFSHQAHADQLCLDCHVRLVHRGVPPLAYRDPATMSSCLSCHDGTTAPGRCSYCHTPPHEPRGECSSCHSLTSWGSAGSEHPFPREGAHAGLDCTNCHVSKSGVENIPGTTLAKADPACNSCHGDQHGGLTDCASCHTPTSWSDINFTHPFPIDGGHTDLTCADCHESKPGVANIPGTQFPAANPACISCHSDQHKGLTNCASCHTPTSWSDINFTHPFKLTGAHASLSCANCHGTPFKKVGSTCVSCHGTKHGGLTDCARCHTTKAWEPSTFRHPRVGEHMPSGEHRLSCSDCHKSGFATATCTPCHDGPPDDD